MRYRIKPITTEFVRCVKFPSNRFNSLCSIKVVMQPLGEFDPSVLFDRMTETLLDAASYEKKARAKELEAQTIQERMKRILRSLDELGERIASLGGPPEENPALKDAHSKIVRFATSVIEQAKEEVSQAKEKEKQSLLEESASLRTRALKGLEAFLATDPLPVISRVIKLKLREGSYEATGEYLCVEKLEYEFQFDTSKNEFLSGELAVSRLVRDIRLPIRVGRSWIKREPVLLYEKLGDYILESLELTDTNTMATFTRSEKNSQVAVVHTFTEGHVSVDVRFSDSSGTTDLMTNPVIAKSIDKDALRTILERLREVCLDIDKQKTRLLSLRVAGEDLLTELKVFDFLLLVCRIISKNMGSASVDQAHLQLFREKLAALEDQSATVLSALGIAQTQV
jgi:hypothetical protein